MKLDRNIVGNEGRGKYALLKLRDLAMCEPQGTFERSPVADALKVLEDAGVIDWGEQGTQSEFFVIRLKDRYAEDALHAYAEAATNGRDPEYAEEVRGLANRAGPKSPWCKRPD